MAHFIYKTTLKGSNKYYIGRKSTPRPGLDKYYFGSGKWIKSIKDKSRLNREILEFTQSFDKLKKLEEKYLKEHINDPDCMNFTDKSKGFGTGKLNPMSNPKFAKNHQKATHPWFGGMIQRRTQQKLIKNGTHLFLNGDIQRKTNKERVENKTHNFLGGEIQRRTQLRALKEGTHNSSITHTCPHCNKTGKGPGMFRFHFDNCKELQHG